MNQNALIVMLNQSHGWCGDGMQMITKDEERELKSWTRKEGHKWRKKKIDQLINKVNTGGKLTSIEKNILKTWQKHYGN